MKERERERERERESTYEGEEAYQTEIKHLRHQERKKMKEEHFVGGKKSMFLS